MIGLGFLAVGLLWFAISWYLATRLLKWCGIVKPLWRWVLGSAAFLLLMVGPFVDHIVGMRQFQRLCDEQTGLQIYPNAAKTTRGKQDSSKFELLSGTTIPIKRSVSTIIDLDTGDVIARYNYFTTRGGVIGGAPMMGGEYVCSIKSPQHPNHQEFLTLKAKVKLTYGEAK